MGFAEILTIVSGIMKFWSEVVWLVKFLQKTPEEKKQEIMAKIKTEAENFEQTGRPSWT